AEQHYRKELSELVRLEQNRRVQKLTVSAQTDMANVLTDRGKWSEAKQLYQVALKTAKELGDLEQRAVITGQLGSLALMQGKLTEAAVHCKKAISLFQGLSEPIHVAVYTHQLGVVYQQAENWKAAEQAYRESARLREDQGLLGGSNGAGASWNQLAIVCLLTNRLTEAEQWFRKALQTFREGEDKSNIASTLNNLAGVLISDPTRLDEARRLAEDGVAIAETLNPATAQIWNTYELLAHIATQQGDSIRAAAYRDKSRKAYLAFPGWRQQIYQHERLIAAVVQATINIDSRKELESVWDNWAGGERANLIAAIRCIIGGERDEAVLFEPLGYMEAALIRAILEGIEEQG
ncbi:MAG: tetratricopeptide repeat protein, partial [Candidatus Electrothrix sp. AUS4]|nr:tetratricopeptide repeat protein [Candidatus Electrothrix sp. AUS4]